MHSAARLFATFVAASLVACVTHASPPPAQVSNAGVGGRFGDLHDLVLAEEREAAPQAVKIGPRYPELAKREGIEAIVPTAFVVDTLGAVEPQSITFLGTPGALSDFRASVCDFLVSRARFSPLMRDGRRRRAFVLQPFSFSLTRGSPNGSATTLAEQRAAVRRTSWDSVATLLAKQPHCR